MSFELLGDRYELHNPIGHGSTAIIYRGQDLRMNRAVAIKVLREEYSTDLKFVTRFQREAKVMTLLQHPNIVQGYDYGQTNGNYFIVMEFVEGTDLRRYLRTRGILDADHVVKIAYDVALGLGEAHRRGMIHRNLKPQNILVGRGGSIKLTSFSIANIIGMTAEERSTTGISLNGILYRSPECSQGGIVTPATDVYALGSVMYELLTGRPPFNGDSPVALAMQHIQNLPVSPRRFNPTISTDLEEIILRCLEKETKMRFRDGTQLARALETLM